MKLLFSLLAALAFSAGAFAQDYSVTGPEELRQYADPAKAVAEKFLKHFDLGNYRSAEQLVADSANRKGEKRFASPVMQAQAASLKKYGKMESREIESVRVSRSYPQMPDGEFVIVTYKATFPKKEILKQSVVLRIDGTKYEVVNFSPQATAAY